MKKTVFYHAGCPVCIEAEAGLIALIPSDKLLIVQLGDEKEKIAEAERAGVKSVPALVLPEGNVLHINFGAALADLKK